MTSDGSCHDWLTPTSEHNYSDCRPRCIHGRRQSRCRDCGTGLCKHNKFKHCCFLCGTGHCEHGRQKSFCRDCGTGYCKHQCSKYYCRLCNSSSTPDRVKKNRRFRRRVSGKSQYYNGSSNSVDHSDYTDRNKMGVAEQLLNQSNDDYHNYDDQNQQSGKCEHNLDKLFCLECSVLVKGPFKIPNNEKCQHNIYKLLCFNCSVIGEEPVRVTEEQKFQKCQHNIYKLLCLDCSLLAKRSF